MSFDFSSSNNFDIVLRIIQKSFPTFRTREDSVRLEAHRTFSLLRLQKATRSLSQSGVAVKNRRSDAMIVCARIENTSRRKNIERATTRASPRSKPKSESLITACSLLDVYTDSLYLSLCLPFFLLLFLRSLYSTDARLSQESVLQLR